MTLPIRQATVEDALGIAEVHVRGWQTTYRGMIPDAYLDAFSIEERARRWDHLLHNPERQEFIFVAVDAEQRIAGFSSGGPNRTQDAPEYTGELYSIYLRADVQRGGLGSSLARHVVDELLARGYDSMLVWVLSENPARRFYEAMGGVLVREGTFEAGGATIPEVAYGWRDLRTFPR